PSINLCYTPPLHAALPIFITNVLGPVFRWLWNKVVGPVFRGIGKVISNSWNYVIKPLFKAWIGWYENVLYPAIRFLYNDVIKPTDRKSTRLNSSNVKISYA